MTRSERARRALGATRTNVVPFIPVEREIPRRHLVPDCPIYYRGSEAIEAWCRPRSTLLRQDMLALGIAERVCRARLRETEARHIAQDFEFNGVEALVSMAAARRRFELFADILHAGKDRFAAMLIDANEGGGR